MTIEKLKVLTHSWSITGTVPNPDQKHPHYGSNVHIGVQASSMEEALAATRKVYPTITFFACHHRGEVHIVV